MKKSALILFLTSVGIASTVQGSQTEDFTVQHLVKINKLHSAALSHDGDHLAYAIKKFDSKGKASSDLYIQDLSKVDSTVKQLTSGAGTEHNVAFSADDETLYFLADRNGSSQLYSLSLSGGEAVQLSDLPLDIEGFKLSLDTKQVVFSLRVFPDCKDLACSKAKFTAEEKRESTGREYKQLMVRHWDTWGDHSRSHLFVAQLNGEKISTAVDVTAGLDTETPPKPFSGMEEVTFTPDGKHVVYSAKFPSKDQAWTTNYDLWQVSVSGGKAVNLTEDNKAWDAQPTYSADGRYLAYLAMTKPGFEADRYRIMLRDTVTDQEKEFAPLWDRSPKAIAFGKDNRTLYVTAQNVGQVSIFEVNTQFGDVKALFDDGSNSMVGVTNDKIIFKHKSLDKPDDLHRINLDGQGTKRLTNVNKENLAKIKFGEFEQFSFKGWNDEKVHGYWIKPTNYQMGKQYPIAFLVHGGPQGSFGNSFSRRWNAQLWAGAGYGVVMIDFHGSTGYGQAFTDSITKDWGGKPLEDLQKGFAAVMKQQQWLDGNRVCALGGSYGGYMMNWIQGNWSDGFNCLVNHAGLFDMRSMYYVTEELWFPEYEFGGTYRDNKALYEQFNPVNFVENWKTPMLVIHGEQDFRVPYGQGLAAFSVMQRKGIPSELLIYPDENHWILNPDNLEQWYAKVLGWMDRWTEKK